MAMCVVPREPSHSDKARRPLVVVANVRTSRSTLEPVMRREQATTVSLCIHRAPPAWSFHQRNSTKRAPGALLPRGTVGGARKLPIQLMEGLGRTKRRPISAPTARYHLATDVKAFHTRRVGQGRWRTNEYLGTCWPRAQSMMRTGRQIEWRHCGIARVHDRVCRLCTDIG